MTQRRRGKTLSEELEINAEAENVEAVVQIQTQKPEPKKELTFVDVVTAAVNGIIKLNENQKNKGIYRCCELVVNQIQQEVDVYEKRRIKEKTRQKKQG